MKTFKILTLLLLFLSVTSVWSNQIEPQKTIVKKFTNEFMSIKTVPANLRTGPNTKYPISWIYIKNNEPVKIVDKFEQWYMINDINNNQGWLHARLLSKEKYAIVRCKDQIVLRKDGNDTSKAIAYIKNDVRVSVLKCNKKWCMIKKGEISGWLEKRFLWGV